LIRGDIDATGFVDVTMTLTSPGCPVAGSLPGEVEEKVKAVPGVRDARVKLVWEPTWTKDMMSEAAQLTLGFI
jgi:metal-sulfur cluster biosynthetic enzyme